MLQTTTKETDMTTATDEADTEKNDESDFLYNPCDVCGDEICFGIGHDFD